MQIRSRRAIAVCCSIAAALPLAARGLEPQAHALEDLARASSMPPAIEFRAGFPLEARFDVPASGASALERARQFSAQYAELFRLRAGHAALLPRRSFSDGIGEVVSLYQTWKGVPVFASQLAIGLAETRSGPRVRFARGALLSDRGEVVLDPDPAIPAYVAEEGARTHLDRRGARILGETRLWIFDPALVGASGPPRLVWAVSVEGEGPVQVLVDAHDGAIAFAHPLRAHEAGLTGYEAAFFSYAEEDRICQNPPTCNTFQIPVVATESGVDPGWWDDDEVVLAWWSLTGTWLFYHEKFGLHSWDGKSGRVDVRVHGLSSNAHYLWDEITFSDGWVSYDVLAHEFTHGVIDHSSDLIYYAESGALNESYADVMAALIDADDWLIAEDRTSGLGAIRSLAHPPAFGHPDRYSQRCTPTNNYCGYAADDGGVHTNSGISNKAHYLMAQGGSHNGRSVAGMGRAKLATLAYHVMVTAPPTLDLLGARHLSVGTAIQLQFYGIDGFTLADVCTVRNAWRAVELGDGDQDCDGVQDAWEDSDADQIGDAVDNCPNVSNPSQLDWNQDGLGDACQDSDGDGVADAADNCPGVYNPWPQPDFDGDSQGNACDPDDDGDGAPDGVDNCPFESNPSQLDGNQNGEGDACDPDLDGDGVYASDADNCPFTPNTAQEDADQDGLGDACDGCPGVADNSGLWVKGMPEFGIPPHPFQPDSDGDGLPDACDPTGFGSVALTFAGLPFNPTQPILPDGVIRAGALEGPAGAALDIPLPACDPQVPLASDRALELRFEDLPRTVSAWIEDDLGARAGKIVDPPPEGGARSLRFAPDCSRTHRLHLALGEGFAGAGFGVSLAAVDATGPSPWIDPLPFLPQPPPIADADRDGLLDRIDRCPVWPDPEQADADADGRGDECECGDQDGDGRSTVSDLVAINAAIFRPERVTPLCDADNDGACRVTDLIAANIEIYSPGNTSTCARQPSPGP
jgi:hypothetical protein